MDQSVEVAGTEGKEGGYFGPLPPLNENTGSVEHKNIQHELSEKC